MSLREYERKRNFRRTPEPASRGAAQSDGANRRFVIQKHDASRLHYDFRLELGGVLKSWAVPKGPSLDPSVKSLAVAVEDHPLEYASFEGVIPEGEYGGGAVMLWDRGVWEPEGDPVRAYREGKLKFTLHGEKLRGSWALVRMGGRAGEDGRNWLLIKHRDSAAKPHRKYDVLTREPLSVVSGRDLPEIAAAADRTWSSRAAPKANGRASRAARNGRRATKPKQRPAAAVGKSAGDLTNAAPRAMPRSLRPQLATLATAAPRGDAWLHEMKFDGYRILTHLNQGRARLISRNGKDWTKRFAAVAHAATRLPLESAVLDGEVVALDAQGRSNFQLLQNSVKNGDDAALAYYVFDLPYADGFDLRATPLVERKALLRRALPKSSDGLLRYSDHLAGGGEAVVAQACRQGLEGIVAKRADSGYQSARSRDWLKVKCSRRQEFVIGGYTRPAGARVGLGALLLGFYEGDALCYCGRVGTGFTDQSLRDLAARLKKLRQEEPPFGKNLDAAARRGASWTRPELVCEVEFTEWTSDGRLRHPSFQGLREDKPPRQITREEAQVNPRSRRRAARSPKAEDARSRSAPSTGSRDEGATVAGIRISHPDRVLYPEQGVTKLDLAHYYEWIADRMLPFVAGRPLTLVRCPAGSRGKCFYQKHLAESAPPSVRGVRIREKTGVDEYLVVDDAAGLVSLVQMGVLEIHPWPARADKIESPDLVVFDLDPGPDVAWPRVVEAARACRDRLENLGLTSFVRTSGGKGLHVVAPLVRRGSWTTLKSFAQAVAEEMVRRDPERYVATMSKAKRQGKIFVDYLRNQRGSTAIAAYSTRARPGAPVATPLAWSELAPRLRPDQFTVANLPERLANERTDPWAGFFDLRQSITQGMLKELRG